MPKSTEQVCSSNDDIWQFPKRAVKIPRRLQKQDLYENRYGVLAEASNIFTEDAVVEESHKRDQISSYSAVGRSFEVSKEGSTERMTSQTGYPREENYVEAVRSRPALDEKQNRQGKYQREVNYAEAVRTRPALDENQNRQGKYPREESHTEAVRMRPAPGGCTSI